MSDPTHALSLKQPWAALLVHGRKSIEVRNWPTPKRGRFWIHAARVPDRRDEAWRHVTADVRDTAELAGGIIGIATLIDCKTYESLNEFNADRARHLNEPEWFQPPRLYGFVFADMEIKPYERLPGWMRFFPVELGKREDLTAEDAELSSFAATRVFEGNAPLEDSGRGETSS